MLSYSPEAHFVLSLFGGVLSGVCLVVALWIQRREASGGRTPFVPIGFLLLATSFGLEAGFCRLTISSLASYEDYAFLLPFGDAARLVAGGLLVAGWLVKQGARRLVPLVLALTAVLGAAAVFRLSADAQAALQSIVPMTTGRNAAAIVFALGAALLGVSRAWIAASALALLAIGCGGGALGRARPPAIELAWGIEHVMLLLGVFGLALALEREVQDHALRFFLRLNLCFLILASSLVIVLTEIGRRQFLDYAATESLDLAEFVRGQVLYDVGRGLPPRDVLSDEAIVRKIVADFGRLPDLRRVEVSFGGQEMALVIAPDGEIAQRFSAGHSNEPPRTTQADFDVSALVTLPIVVAEGVGSVALHHSLRRINEKIGRQMDVVFAVFTFSVMLVSGATGMLVLRADRTIRLQHQELERTQRSLSVAERLASIGAVVGDAAHEINNPAAILVARTEYLLSTLSGTAAGASIREDLETIRRQAQRIGKTARELLGFARPVQLVRERCNVRTIVESAIALVNPLAARRLATVRAVYRADTVIFGDRDRLEQVFTNLITNAIQASDEHGEIRVTVGSAPDGRAEVSVRDDGCGIPAGNLERIFDPFFSTKRPGSGTGLGLTIAYGIVRDHGGSIDVASIPEQGSEFRVRLPSAGETV